MAELTSPPNVEVRLLVMSILYLLLQSEISRSKAKISLSRNFRCYIAR